MPREDMVFMSMFIVWAGFIWIVLYFDGNGLSGFSSIYCASTVLIQSSMTIPGTLVEVISSAGVTNALMFSDKTLCNTAGCWSERRLALEKFCSHFFSVRNYLEFLVFISDAKRSLRTCFGFLRSLIVRLVLCVWQSLLLV